MLRPMHGVSDPIEIPVPVQNRNLTAQPKDWIFWKTGGVSVTHRERGPWGEGKRLLATGQLTNLKEAIDLAKDRHLYNCVCLFSKCLQ